MTHEEVVRPMHEFYEYLATQLAEKLTKRRVVVWYDAAGRAWRR